MSIYELTYSIKDKFSSSEIKLINDEKKISICNSKKKIISKKQNNINENINEESINEIQNYIDLTINGLNISDNDDEIISDKNNTNFIDNKRNIKFTKDLYNDKKIFNYLNCKYLTYHKNSCWIDCFIMLYIFIFKKIIIKMMMENYDNIFPQTLKY